MLKKNLALATNEIELLHARIKTNQSKLVLVSVVQCCICSTTQGCSNPCIGCISRRWCYLLWGLCRQIVDSVHVSLAQNMTLFHAYLHAVSSQPTSVWARILWSLPWKLVFHNPRSTSNNQSYLWSQSDCPRPSRWALYASLPEPGPPIHSPTTQSRACSLSCRTKPATTTGVHMSLV